MLLEFLTICVAHLEGDTGAKISWSFIWSILWPKIRGLLCGTERVGRYTSLLFLLSAG